MKPKIAAVAGLIGLAGALVAFIYASRSGAGVNPLYWLLAVGVGYLIYRRDVPLAALQRIRRKTVPSVPHEEMSPTDGSPVSRDEGSS